MAMLEDLEVGHDEDVRKLEEEVGIIDESDLDVRVASLFWLDNLHELHEATDRVYLAPQYAKQLSGYFDILDPQIADAIEALGECEAGNPRIAGLDELISSRPIRVMFIDEFDWLEFMNDKEFDVIIMTEKAAQRAHDSIMTTRADGAIIELPI